MSYSFRDPATGTTHSLDSLKDATAKADVLGSRVVRHNPEVEKSITFIKRGDRWERGSGSFLDPVQKDRIWK